MKSVMLETDWKIFYNSTSIVSEISEICPSACILANPEALRHSLGIISFEIILEPCDYLQSFSELHSRVVLKHPNLPYTTILQSNSKLYFGHNDSGVQLDVDVTLKHSEIHSQILELRVFSNILKII